MPKRPCDLEAELARQFAPVSAPDSLWDRIHEQRRPLRVRPTPWQVWSIAAATMLMLLAGLVWRAGATRGASGRLDVLAARESGLQSGDPAEIRRWIQDRTGVDVTFPEGLESGTGAVRLLGARLARVDGVSTAVLTYRVGEQPEADYVVAFGGSKESGRACLLCHVSSPALMLLR